MEEKNINQYGDKSIYVENAENINLNQKNKYTKEEIIKNFFNASFDLRTYRSTFGENKVKIPRQETDSIFNWVKNDIIEKKSNIAVLVGGAGTGKSVVLNNLYDKLINDNIPVIGIKSDSITFSDSSELAKQLYLKDDIETLFNTVLQKSEKSVIIIDQIDALSLSLSTDRSSLRTIRQIIDKFVDIHNVRIVISCREFDLNYDPYLEYYKSKEIFRISPLSIDNVKFVLQENNIENVFSQKFIDFLRTPLHLNIFCQVADSENSNEYETLQELYSDFWKKKIKIKPKTKSLDTLKIIEFVEKISTEMYDKQQISVNTINYEDIYQNEIEYLSSEGIILELKNKLQFIHQSFFDYAYARTFVKSGKQLSEVLKNDHQGLFIRPKIRQVLAYLRDIEPIKYISELETILLSEDYRFHIKHLLLGDLSFVHNPTINEKKLIKDELYGKEDLLFQIFLESVNSIEWFNFLTNDLQIQNKLQTENKTEFINAISFMCRRLLNEDTSIIVTFLNNLPDFENKFNFIANTIHGIKKENSVIALELFDNTQHKWNELSFYYFLEKLLDQNPKKVIEYLKLRFYENIKNVKEIGGNYIPGAHQSEEIHKRLGEEFPELSYPYFIEIISEIVEKTQSATLPKPENSLYGDWAFYHFIPFKESAINDIHHKVYEMTLQYLSSECKNNTGKIRTKINDLLKSKYTSIINIGVITILKCPEKFIEEAYILFNRPDFFLLYTGINELFTFNIQELLKVSFPFLSKDQQENIFTLIREVVPAYETKKRFFYEKGANYSATQQGYSKLSLLKMLPKDFINKNGEDKKEYQELKRAYSYNNHEKPKGIQTIVGYNTLPDSAYKKMNNKQWKQSFKKITNETKGHFRDVDETGHRRRFELEVSKSPERFASLINEIIEDKTIKVLYIISGLQGLKEAKYHIETVKNLFLRVVEERKEELHDRYLIYLVWLTDYFIEEREMDKRIFDFLCDIAINYPNSKMADEKEPVQTGINTIRGASADRIVKCFIFKEFEEQIFTTLEFLAKAENKVDVPTRASALSQMALLNNLDKQRNLQLFLNFNYDFNPNLLSMRLHNTHPLVYLIHVDFQKLISFFEKAITVPESHKVISHILFFAWLQDYKGSKELLDKVLNASMNAKITVTEVAFEQMKNEKFFDKSFQIIKKHLDYDNEDLGAVYEHSFMNLSISDFTKIENFIDNYVASKVGKYREYYFYKFLLNIVKSYPEKCLEWTLFYKEHNTTKLGGRVLEREPLQVVIQAYNSLKEFKNKGKEDDSLELAMGIFDDMLKVPEYRGRITDVLDKMDL